MTYQETTYYKRDVTPFSKYVFRGKSGIGARIKDIAKLHAGEVIGDLHDEAQLIDVMYSQIKMCANLLIPQQVQENLKEYNTEKDFDVYGFFGFSRFFTPDVVQAAAVASQDMLTSEGLGKLENVLSSDKTGVVRAAHERVTATVTTLEKRVKDYQKNFLLGREPPVKATMTYWKKTYPEFAEQFKVFDK